jgi:RNA polymerase sigma factor (sigma-70 family)
MEGKRRWARVLVQGLSSGSCPREPPALGYRSNALDEWISLALPGAVAYASALLGDRTHGEDIVQDCVCRLLVNAARYDLNRDGRKILFRAITNACINRQTRERKTLSLDEQGRPPKGGGWEVEDTAAHPPPTLAMAQELRQAIADGLATLGVRYRAALELSSLGYDAREIGEMLDVGPENVRVLLFRARKAMAVFLNARFKGGVSQ